MKAYLKIVVGAIFIGGILAFLFYKDIHKEVMALTKSDNVVYLFQVGVFKEYDNALACKEKYHQAQIYKDQEYYRVFLSVTVHNKEKLTSFYVERDIAFFAKEVKVDDELRKKIEQYDKVLEQTQKEDVFYKINEAMLELFVKSVT